MERAPLIRATGAGLILQLAMVIAGHFLAAIRDPGFAIGGTLFSFVAGQLFALLRQTPWGVAIVGGAIAGGCVGCSASSSRLCWGTFRHC